MSSSLAVVVPPPVDAFEDDDWRTPAGSYTPLPGPEDQTDDRGWGAATEADSVLVPLVDADHEPGCCGGMCPGESCERCGNFCFFFTVCTASLVATMATTALCVADTATISTIYVWLAPEFQITKPQTGIGYHFNHTVNDLVWSSCVRTFLALASHAASSRENKYRPYLYVSLFVTLVCGVHVALKAVFFDYVWVVDKWVLPLLLTVTVVACLGHVIVAYSMSVHAAKTLRRQKNMREGLLGVTFGADTGLGGLGGFTGGDEGVGGVGGAGDATARSAASSSSSPNLCGSEPAVDAAGDVPAEALAEPDSRFAVVGGVKLHYKDVGGGALSTTGFGKNAALVLIHGFGAGVFAWRRVGPALAAARGMRVVALDRPGFGLSERPERGCFPEEASPYAVTTQARLVEELCARLGITDAVFAGHADGCLVAMRAAVAGRAVGARVRTSGLVLLSANAQLDAAVPAPVRLLLNTTLGMTMMRPLLRSEIGEVANRRAWHDRSKLTRSVLSLYQRPLCVEGWDRALLEAARTRLGLTQRDISTLLAALVETPVLMVTGANDVVAPPRRAVAVATELRRCMLKLLPRCGHLPHEEAPEQLLEALVPFLMEHLPRSSDAAVGDVGGKSAGEGGFDPSRMVSGSGSGSGLSAGEADDVAR